MAHRSGQRGMLAALAAFVLLIILAAFLAAHVAALAGGADRDAASDRAIAQAREALLAHAADRPIDRAVGPGYLPCPDLDGDGWAEPTCGSLTGESGQAQRLGRLPWKTLGLPDLRDGHGERLWYAVSSRHKGLLNCAASRACVDMSPPVALGTITVRAPSGALLHDGTVADPRQDATAGAAAVVLAAGPPLRRADGREQRRGCVADCEAADFLDVSTAFSEDNAAFRDRSDAAGRAANRDGFIAGPAADGAGRLEVNDRVGAVGPAQILPRVMSRVALEAALCLREHAALPSNGGRLPEPEACAPGSQPPVPFGRVPAIDLPACNLDPGGTSPAWWSTWRQHVLYAPSRAALGGPGGCAAPGECIDAIDAEGRTLAAARRFALVVTREAGQCASARLRCDARACTQVVLGEGRDVAMALP
ncbi:MAG TPA: hypothetical protein VFK48_04015 [Usitatibacter sp.]|nr:hypothetical protein [Usitatibacter sp.]